MNGAQKPHHHHHHIAMLPPPGFLGHLFPFIELTKRLISLHNCHATIIIIPHNNNNSTLIKLQKTLLENLPPAIKHIFLPPVHTTDLPVDDINPQILYPTCVIRSLPHLREALTSFDHRVSALVMDLFAPFAIDVARELGIQSYIFYTSPASELALCINLPNLERSLESEFRDLSEPLKIPGSDTTIAAEDLPDAFHNRSSGVYKMLVEMAKKYQSADGIIVNTFLELERHAFEFLEQHRHEWPPVYAVGPLIRLDSDRNERRHIAGSDQCMKWLNDQPRRSVLYVSFGSGASVSREQFDELALGLEMSRHRFLWVVRSPQDNTVASYLNTNNRARDDPLKFLPLGFLQRVRERGLLVIDWAPQIEILSHESIGGYMTHCGWNSILESVVFGVPLIARPLVFEQNTNAVLITDCLGVGIRVRAKKEKGVVGREDIAESVRELMGGGELMIGLKIRRKMNEFKNAASRALELDGSSTKSLAEVFQRMTSGKGSSIQFHWLKSSM